MKTKPKLQAFSLLEVLVSMGIVAFIMLMLNNVIINTATLSQKALARSVVREEVSSIADQISTDIRLAERVGVCEGSLARRDLYCEVYGLEPIVWQSCDADEQSPTGGRKIDVIPGPGYTPSYEICRFDERGNVLFQNSDTMLLRDISIDAGLGVSSNLKQRNLLITIVADHNNPAANVTNVTRQVAVATRNYTLL